MKLRKLTALILSLVMMMSLSVTAFAGTEKEGSLTGDGKVEAIYDSDVFNVVLPTVDENTTTFDFVLDPQGVLYDTKDTNQYYFNGKSSLYFTNIVDDVYYYMTDTSDELSILNKSSFDVEVSLSAEVKNLDEDVSLYYESDFVGTNPEIYLALTDGTNTKAITAEGGKLTGKINFRPDSYELTSEQDSGKYYYSYGLKEDLDDSDFYDYYEYKFQLTGACNVAADWSELGGITPQVEVTWSVDKYYSGSSPVATALNVTVAESIDLVAAGLNAGSGDKAATGIKEIKFPADTELTSTQKKYVSAGTGLTVNVSSTGVSKITSGDVTNYSFIVVLNDIKNTEVTVTLKKS